MSGYEDRLTVDQLAMACSHCGAARCKLWRESATCDPRVLCGPCALAEEERGGLIDERGRVEGEHGVSDQIGSYVPAVPCAGDTFWGYTSVPDDACAWWHALPTYPKVA